MCARREWKKQIINFGISFQLKVASTTEKNRSRSLVEFASFFFEIREAMFL